MIGYLFGFSFLYNILNNCATNFTRQSCLKLDEDNYINIIKMKDNSNNYAINSNTYLLKYFVKKGNYKIKDIPPDHPMAILNSEKESKINIRPINNENIIINVNGGNLVKNSEGDYYDFSINNNPISINNTFYFMIGKTYEFKAGNINTLYPFEIVIDGINNRVIKNRGDSITITINKNTTIKYQCTIHSFMNGKFNLLNRNVEKEGEITANYNFYYGDIELIVDDDFDKVSLFCFYHGYMGGKNLLEYNENCGEIS